MKFTVERRLCWYGLESAQVIETLVFLQYINDVVKLFAIPYIQRLDKVIFQQDNYGHHTTAIAAAVVPSSRQYSYGPMNHAFAKSYTNRLHLEYDGQNYRNASLLFNEQLCDTLQIIWDDICQDSIDHLIGNVPVRTAKWIRFHGAPTNYWISKKECEISIENLIVYCYKQFEQICL